MKPILAVILAGFVFPGFARDGWNSLFDGQTFAGWSFDTFDKAAPEDLWNIEDGRCGRAISECFSWCRFPPHKACGIPVAQEEQSLHGRAAHTRRVPDDSPPEC